MFKYRSKLNTLKYHYLIKGAFFCSLCLSSSWVFAVNQGITDLERLNAGDLSTATGVSADGATLVGTANDGDNVNASRAIYWTEALGTLTSLGTLNAGNSSQGLAISGDGTTVVGFAANGGVVGNPNYAFKWTLATGMQILGDNGIFTDGSNSAATAVNTDGSVVVGFGDDPMNGYIVARAFYWNGGALLTGLAPLSLNLYSKAYGVSGDGSKIVGDAQDGGGRTKAVLWAGVLNPPQSLGDLGGTQDSFARAISTDGRVVVGMSTSDALVEEAFSWTQAGGMVGLGGLNGGNISQAFAVNSDGSVVVGQAVNGPLGANRGFRYTTASGMQSVEDWLRSTGVSVPADITDTANGVSSDGTIVVGKLANDDAYIARAGSGLVTVGDLSSSLSPMAQMGPNLVNINNLLMDGAHSYPLTGLLPEDRQYNVWVLGDLAKLPEKAKANAGEVGLSRRLLTGLQGSIGIGRTHDKQRLAFGGYYYVDGTYTLAELIGQFPGTSFFTTVSGFYNWGDMKSYRGYLNAGALDQSFGAPNTRVFMARARLDWKEALKLRTTSLSPYVEVSQLDGRIKSYTEQGGGFPTFFNERKPSSRNGRLGVRGYWTVAKNTRLLATGEGVLNMYRRNPGVSGQVIGLVGFNIAATQPQRRWLRGNIGVEQTINGDDKLSIILNGTTKGQDPRYWLAASYYLSF